MKAIVCNEYGGPDVLRLEDVDKPEAKPEEVLIRVRATAVNDWDWGLVRGTPRALRPMSGLLRPKVNILGVDVAGLVEAVGESVTRFRPGDEVYGDLSASGFGAFAEYVCAPESALARKPGVLRTLGVDHVIDYRQEDFTRTGQRYDLILDARTTRAPGAYARALNPGGTYATVGGYLRRLLQLACVAPLIRTFNGKNLRVVVLKANKDLPYVNELYEAGKLQFVIDGPFDLSEIRAAVQRFGDAKHKGKVVITVSRE